MTQYRVFTHSSGASEAVKQGWSWPAFLFSYWWAFFKRQYALGASVLAGSIALGAAMGYAQAQNDALVVVNLLAFCLNVAFGMFGNRWRERNLLKRGYKDAGLVGVQNSDKAVATCLDRSSEQHA